MSLKIKVSNTIDPGSVEGITNAINTVDPTLDVDVDLTSQTVTIQPKDPNMAVASEESIRQAVTAAGYSIRS
ncbi:heavy-metal-associated domain-containing protein [Altericista sp. CCNU0014]|uniref:heavy-metal-associated domain-containing protein n=1 Tax=Altericista sp. CCNU0014 TaxID=3082949 RepID=UPI00384AE5C3